MTTTKRPWQNAAESLPAHPENELGTCRVSSVLHTKGSACIGWEPVAPVEAKDKPLCVGGHCPGTGQCMLCAEPKPTPSKGPKYFLLPNFIAAMNDIGRYGYEKYADQSFQARAQAGDTSRSMDRTQPEAIRDHAAAHFQMHIDGTLHDHFGTRKHQLAAVAFNAMMEYYFAGLDSEEIEQLKPQPDSSSIPEIELELRRMMWLGHGHTGMYGDDGEMQCAECLPFGVVDYKREPLDKVRETFRAVQMERMMKPRDSSSISTEPPNRETLNVIIAAQRILEMFTSGHNPTEAQLNQLDAAIFAAKGQR